ncbi:Protein SULFUR DEFICIENCY-INDUCED 2 [Linum perenne]
MSFTSFPPGDGPYVRAKHVQGSLKLAEMVSDYLVLLDFLIKLVEKDPDAAVEWFMKAINSGDRVDSALKDMALVMKQQDRSEEAIEAIRRFRHLCSKQAQESLDNVLIDLYKGNLGWAYMQLGNYPAAEAVYLKAQLIDPDANKACNLCTCLLKQMRYDEARTVLDDVVKGKMLGYDDPKSRNRMEELIQEVEMCQSSSPLESVPLSLEDAFAEGIDQMMEKLTPYRSKRLPIFEEISPVRDQLAC